MAIQNPKYDNDYVTLGYLKKTINEENSETNKKIETIPKNYNSPPVPPYYVGSLLLINGTIYRCIKSRLVGSFNMSDWQVVVSTEELDEALKFIYDVNKLEYVDQQDGVIETFYQKDDPSVDWITNLDKENHVSDLWTVDLVTHYQYEKKTTNPVAYGWKKINVPSSLFDVFDGHKRIFLNKPTNYEKDDLWFGETTKVAIESSETFDESHWEERDDFIQSSRIEQEEYHKIYLLPKITEINRQSLAEIKKAVDEITLTVSQTYTTKTEVEKYVDDVKTEVAETYTTKEEMNAQFSIASNQINSIVEKNLTQDNEMDYLNQEYSVIKQQSKEVQISVSKQQTQINNVTGEIERIDGTLNEMNYNFGTDALNIAKPDSPNSAKINNEGMKLYNYDNLKLISNQNGTGIQKLIVVGDAQIGYLRFVKEKDEKKHECTDIHHLVSNIQTLEDLEVEINGN